MRIPLMDGLTAPGQIRKRHPNVNVVILSAIGEPEQIQAALGQSELVRPQTHRSK
jgi:DNA-binding NarL/FixJ family response regulator